MMPNEKIQPQDLESEQSVLGSMMISKDAIALVVGNIKSDYFYKQAHAYIFDCIVELYKKNEPVDLVTVSSSLKKKNQLTDIGGRQYIAQLVDSVPTASNAHKYAEIIREKALLRRLILAGSDIVKQSFEDQEDVNVVLEQAQKNILDISSESFKEDFVKIEHVIKDVFENIQNTYDSEDKILGVPSGYPDLDALTAGFQKSDLIILAARPSMGKTAFALNIASNVAIRKNIPVAIFSLEMPKEQLAMRMLSAESKLDSKRLKTSNLHEHEYKNLTMGMGQLSEAPIYIDDTPGISPIELRAKTRRLQAEADVGLILIDYMQLMKSSKKRVESRYHEVSEIVREVKAFAKESGIPIIALSQLSRAVEQRSADDRVPRLSDLRESGEIEQTADLVMFIHRADYYETANEESPHQTSKTNIVIAKHRNGPTGTVDLAFQKNISKFRSYAPDIEPVPVQA